MTTYRLIGWAFDITSFDLYHVGYILKVYVYLVVMKNFKNIESPRIAILFLDPLVQLKTLLIFQIAWLQALFC